MADAWAAVRIQMSRPFFWMYRRVWRPDPTRASRVNRHAEFWALIGCIVGPKDWTIHAPTPNVERFDNVEDFIAELDDQKRGLLHPAWIEGDPACSDPMCSYRMEVTWLQRDFGSLQAERDRQIEAALFPLDALIGDLRHWNGMVGAEAVLKKLADIRAALAVEPEEEKR
jgi:hypothetical protein